MVTSILEQCNVTPSRDAPIEQSFPLVHFDMLYLRPNPVRIQNLIFYEIPCSRPDFQESIVPKLKTSLSLTLKHYLPYAGRILFPLTPSGQLVSRYASGDSVSLTIAESSADFIYLTGNHPRNADEFYHFSPQMPEVDCSFDFIKIPVLALQVTLFPNKGICIGFNINHAIGDGATALRFCEAWAHATKFEDLPQDYLPFYDRSDAEDPKGLDSACWSMVRNFRPISSSNVIFPTDTVHARLVLTDAEIRNLKNAVMEKRPDLCPVSSFTVASALLWVCAVKSVAEEMSDDEPEYFTSPVNCRTRLSPPLPSNYFGNCLEIVEMESTRGRLKQNDGFIYAVQTIKESISKTLNKENGILEGLEARYSEILDPRGKKQPGIRGSPRFDYYDVDFGWGRAKKLESFRFGAFSLSRSRDFAGGIEVGLSMAKVEMESFVALFNTALGKDQENLSDLKAK